jgi:hypothetical protein
MSSQVESAAHHPPSLKRARNGEIETASLADLIEWFLRYDSRVAVINHPRVEEIFRWKQAEDSSENETRFQFSRAEDRLAIGIFQALAENKSEPELHKWIVELLFALDEASQMNEEIATSYNLNIEESTSPVEEAAKLPSRAAQKIYLNSCWLETLCTAEARVLGWIYQELYGRPFHPENSGQWPVASDQLKS